MATRRGFLTRLMAALPVIGVAPLLGVLPHTDEYAPVGYLTGDEERSRGVEYVTLDGVRIEPADVHACDDVAGWVNTSQPAWDGIDVLVHNRGTVRVYWKPL